MTRTDIEDQLANRLHNLAAYASATPRRDPDLAEVEELRTRRRLPAAIALVANAACVGAAVLITVAVTRDSGPARSRVRVGGETPSVSLPNPPTEPVGAAVHALEIDASNFRFGGIHFDVPAGITDVRLVSEEGRHGLGSDAPELAYMNLLTPGGDNSVRVDFVEGRTYTIYCTVPGHREAGMEATITVGPADSQMVTTATTMARVSDRSVARAQPPYDRRVPIRRRSGERDGDSMELDGKVAIVTGAGSGLGRASAQALAAAGARVAVGDVDDVGAAETVEIITSAGGTAFAHHVDVSAADECQALVQATVATYGGLHILHNNAGVAWPGRDGFAPDMDPAIWDRVIAINLSGTFYCCHFAIPEMVRGGGGSIINTASSMAHLPLGGLDGYAASKGGVALLTKSMAPSAGRSGIRVNAISPGYVDTPMNEVIWGNDAVKHAFELGHATGLQDAEEIADIVVFLASDASRSLTGAVLNCDRGWTAFKQPDLLREF